MQLRVCNFKLSGFQIFSKAFIALCRHLIEFKNPTGKSHTDKENYFVPLSKRESVPVLEATNLLASHLQLDALLAVQW